MDEATCNSRVKRLAASARCSCVAAIHGGMAPPWPPAPRSTQAPMGPAWWARVVVPQSRWPRAEQPERPAAGRHQKRQANGKCRVWHGQHRRQPLRPDRPTLDRGSCARQHPGGQSDGERRRAKSCPQRHCQGAHGLGVGQQLTPGRSVQPRAHCCGCGPQQRQRQRYGQTRSGQPPSGRAQVP